jgi:hypothetical protein
MAVTLYIVVEGDTEERFANQLLVPHLADRGVYAQSTKVLVRGRRGGANTAGGGGRSYAKWKNDLTTWIKQQGHRRDVWFTTMLDLYGLGSFSDRFPEYDEATSITDPYRRAVVLEEAWSRVMGFQRFIPYLQLHEFESLLFVNICALKDIFIEQSAQVESLAAEIVAANKRPEEINDGKDTAPSKRIIRHVPQYNSRKASAGPQMAAAIGLPRLRAECRHFGAWVARIEQLGESSSAC